MRKRRPGLGNAIRKRKSTADYSGAEQKFTFADHLQFDPAFEREGVDGKAVLPKAEAQTQLVRGRDGCRSRVALSGSFRRRGVWSRQQPRQWKLEFEIAQQRQPYMLIRLHG